MLHVKAINAKVTGFIVQRLIFMSLKYIVRGLSALLLSLTVAACGGGGGGGNDTNTGASNNGGTSAGGSNSSGTGSTASGGTGSGTTTGTGNGSGNNGGSNGTNSGNGTTTPPQSLKYPIPSGLWSAPAGSTPATGNYVYLQSDSGDFVGSGRTYSYTDADTQIGVTSASPLRIGLNVQGNQSWTGAFLLPSGAANLQAGYFSNLTRAPFADPAVGGIDWTGEGRGCNTQKGWIVIDQITLSGSVITSLDMRFEQHCEGGSSALHGQIHWSQASASNPPSHGPQPIPASLWKPAPTALPTTGNYVYLQSDVGDYIGQGKTYLYVPTNANLTPTSTGAYVGFNVTGNQNWTSDFKGMQGMSQLAVGYYSGLQRYPFNNPVLGGMDWSGDGRGCNTLVGWFVIDSIAYSGNTLSVLDLRFEQHCEGGGPALHGQIHWTLANAQSSAANPSVPQAIPSNLWKAAPGSTPSSGNYMYLESAPGDYIGGGQTFNYTRANSILTVNNSGAHVGVSVTGDKNWTGDFQGMQGMTQLSVGYYGSLERFPFSNPVLGGIDWSGDGRGCNTLSGWFAIDNITYSNGAISSIDLRFEQHCESAAAAPLHGQLHWTVNDTTSPPGPVNPPPAGLWSPNLSFTAPLGNYVYLVSDVGDYIGGGLTQLYFSNNSSLSAIPNLTAAFKISVGGWTGNFIGMNSLSQLQPGYYGNLERYPFNNPVKGGMDWSGNGRGCNTLNGWFVVDNVSYSLGQLTAIDLRFEQHCEGMLAALHGVVHWTK